MLVLLVAVTEELKSDLSDLESEPSWLLFLHFLCQCPRLLLLDRTKDEQVWLVNVIFLVLIVLAWLFYLKCGCVLRNSESNEVFKHPLLCLTLFLLTNTKGLNLFSFKTLKHSNFKLSYQNSLEWFSKSAFIDESSFHFSASDISQDDKSFLRYVRPNSARGLLVSLRCRRWSIFSVVGVLDGSASLEILPFNRK